MNKIIFYFFILILLLILVRYHKGTAEFLKFFSGAINSIIQKLQGN